MKERERLGSRLGFILISAGCAIGIGNVWKFPYMAGQGGGGAFVLFYLLFLLILGLPIMTMEFAVGRASQKSPVKAYYALEKPGQKWHIHGYITLIGCYLLMMFYTTVAGWMLHYFYLTATGKFTGLDSDAVASQFNTMLSQPQVMGFWMVIIVIAGILVCSIGLQNGLEKVTKVMMISLLFIMVILAINSFFMDGAKEGLSFYLIPDFERMKEIGIIKSRYWCYVYFWKLYWKRTLPARRIFKYRFIRHFCSYYIRSHHFPCLLYIPCRSDFRPWTYLHYSAEYF